MGTSQKQKKPQLPGNALSSGLVLVAWGAFFYYYPQSVNLDPMIQTPLTLFSIACFILGALVAGGGLDDLTDSQFLKNSALAFSQAGIAYVLYLASVGQPSGSLWATLLKVAVMPFALLAIGLFGMGIPHLLASQSRVPSAASKPTSASGMSNEAEAESESKGKFERIASGAIAVVSLLAAFLALVNEVRRGQ